MGLSDGRQAPRRHRRGDIGKAAYIGKTVGIASEFLTIDERSDALTKKLGVSVKYNAVEPDVYRSFGTIKCPIQSRPQMQPPRSNPGSRPSCPQRREKGA